MSRRRKYVDSHPELSTAVKHGILTGKPALGMKRSEAVVTFGYPEQEFKEHSVLGVVCGLLRYKPHRKVLEGESLDVYLQGDKVVGWNWGVLEGQPDQWKPVAGLADVEIKSTEPRGEKVQQADTDFPAQLAEVRQAIRLLLSDSTAGESRLVELAERGNIAAAVELAEQYRVGAVLKRRPRQAFRWAQSVGTLEPPYGPGCYELYQCYSEGIGTDRDARQAIAALLRGRRAGHFQSIYALAQMREQAASELEFEEQEQMIKSAAATYEEALRTEVMQEAVARLEVGGELPGLTGLDLHNVHQALVDIYLGYYGKDYERAADIVRWQLEYNVNSLVRFTAAQMYRMGRGFERNPYIAFKRYMELAQDGYEWAFIWVGRAYAKGEGVPENDLEANKWYWLAAAHCPVDPMGAFELGRQYMEGEGVEKDLEAAYAWLSIANASGWIGESEKKDVRSQLSTSQVNRAQQLAAEISKDLEQARIDRRAKQEQARIDHTSKE